MSRGTDEQFMKRGLGIREILQSIEDALIDGGYDHFMVTTKQGTFHCETMDRARARGSREIVMPVRSKPMPC
jgi:hypothetical protein